MQKLKFSVIFICTILMLTGCGLRKEASDAKKDVLSKTNAGIFSPNSAKQVTDKLKVKLGLKDLVELDLEDISIHYGFNSTYLDDFSAYTSKTEGCADEIAVFKINNDDNRQSAVNSIMEKVELKANSFKEINIKEFNKFDANSVSVHGSYIVILICASPEVAYQILDEFYIQPN